MLVKIRTAIIVEILEIKLIVSETSSILPKNKNRVRLTTNNKPPEININLPERTFAYFHVSIDLDASLVRKPYTLFIDFGGIFQSNTPGIDSINGNNNIAIQSDPVIFMLPSKKVKIVM